MFNQINILGRKFLLIAIISLFYTNFLVAQTCYVHIKCEDGAKVFLDSDFVGITSLDEFGLLIPNVKPGEHTVNIKSKSGQKFSQNFNAPNSGTHVIKVSFDKNEEVKQVLQKEEPTKTNVTPAQVATKPKTQYFSSVDKMPEPVNGFSEVSYPVGAQKDGIEGTVVLQAFINDKGIVDSSVVVQGIGSGCDEAAMKALKETVFSPAIKDGKPVNSFFPIPIKFELPKDQVVKDVIPVKEVHKGTDDFKLVDGQKYYTNPDNPATLKGGISELMKYVKYPDSLKTAGITGTVEMKIFISKTGKKKQVDLFKGFNDQCNFEAAKAILYHAKFSPAIHNNEAVNSILIMPIEFK